MATPTTANSTWVDGSGGGTPITAARLNTAETRIAEALAGFAYTHNEFTSNISVTATTEATANTVATASAITFDGSTAVMIEFFAAAWEHSVADTLSEVWLYDGSSSIGRFARFTSLPVAGRALGPLMMCRRLTPSAAAHTYSVRASTASGTLLIYGAAGGAGTTVPGFIRIVKA